MLEDHVANRFRISDVPCLQLLLALGENSTSGPCWRQQPRAHKVCMSNPGKPTCGVIQLRCAA